MASSKILGILMSRAAKGKTAPASTVPMSASGGNVDESEPRAEEAAEGDGGEADEMGAKGTFPYHAKKARFHANAMIRKQKRAMPVHAKLALHHAMKALDMTPGATDTY